MTDLFAAYGHKATSTAPAPLLGPLKRRADARTRYSEIVDAMAACQTPPGLEAYLQSIRAETVQFAAELEFLWSGDDAFLGLEKEIERARARVDDGLDFPRWEPSSPHASNPLS